MRLVVTGGAGYIGSVTTRTLIEAGHQVVVLDSLERGHAEAVHRDATLVKASVGDVDALDSVLPGTDAVIHLAGYIDIAESHAEPDLYYRKNLAEPSVMLDRMLTHGIRNLVFSSTAAVYGQPGAVPITEDAPARPINTYGASKLAFERMIAVAEEVAGLRAVRLRYFNVAGAWNDGSLGEAHDPETHLVPSVLRAAMGAAPLFVHGDDYDTPDGTCVRDYVHVMDLAQAHLAAAEYAASGREPLVCNLGSERGYSNLEVVRECQKVTGVDLDVAFGPRRSGDPARLVAAAGRARHALGWEPARDLERMVADAWLWHRTHPHGFAANGG